MVLGQSCVRARQVVVTLLLDIRHSIWNGLTIPIDIHYLAKENDCPTG